MVEKNYKHNLRLIKSLLIVTSLQKKRDLEVKKRIQALDLNIKWNDLNKLMIEREVWDYATKEMNYDPKLVFCHPDVLKKEKTSSLYYRGLCGLSIKSAEDHFGAVKNLEDGNPRARLDDKKALKMAQTYNTYISSIIQNSIKWTLEDGYRTIIATIGITLDGRMRNKVGDIAEERIKSIIVDWLLERDLLIEPEIDEDALVEEVPRKLKLINDIMVKFGSEPDIAFYQKDQLLAVIEIKGGTDPAGALERYGAATKSFQHSIEENNRCKNFYLAAVYTSELTRRIEQDRLVEEFFDVIDILEDPDIRESFFKELFHYTLRID